MYIYDVIYMMLYMYRWLNMKKPTARLANQAPGWRTNLQVGETGKANLQVGEPGARLANQPVGRLFRPGKKANQLGGF